MLFELLFERAIVFLFVLQNCIDGVQKAFAAEQYETVAAYIQRYLHIMNNTNNNDENTGDNNNNNSNVTSSSSSSSVLDQNAADQLRAAEHTLKDVIIKKKLEQAIKENNHPQILR